MIVPDHDTEEGLIRNYIRDDWAGDNIFKGALNRAVLAQSSLIRRCLFEEIQSLDRTFNDREQQLIQELAESLGDLPSGGPW